MDRRALHFYVGTQGDGPGLGIHAGALDSASGELSLRGLAAAVGRPTWLEVDRRNQRLFAVSELGNRGERDGEVLSYGIVGPDRALCLIGRTSSGGGGPAHLCLSAAGNTLYAANFGGGQAVAIAVASDGNLGAARKSAPHTGSGPHPRQSKPHPHGVRLDPDERFLLVPDMGNDQVVIHRIDGASGGFASVEPGICQLPSGSGPRLLLFGRAGNTAYVLSELSAELYVFRWDPRLGSLDYMQRRALDYADAEGNPSAAALLIAADGRTLYASNRRSNTMCVFSVDSSTGIPTLIQSIDTGGLKPWGAALSPDGRWLLVANQGSGSVVPFRVSELDGRLTAVTGSAISVHAPTHLVFHNA